MSDEEKYNELRAKLRGIPRVKAKTGFENRLYARLRGVESERMSPSVEHLTRKEKGWIFSLLRPSFIPAIGLTVIVLIALIWYIAYNPMQKDINEQVSSTKHDTQQQPSLTQTPGEEKNEQKNIENPITSNDTQLKDYQETTTRTLRKDAVSGPEKVNSDFNVIRTTTDQVDEKTGVEQTIIRAIPKIDTEKKVEDKIDDGIRRIEKKEAPAIMKGDVNDSKLELNKEEIAPSKDSEGFIKDITPNVMEEKATGKEKGEDTAKQKEIKKKKGKLSNDSLNQKKKLEEQKKIEEQKSPSQDQNNNQK